MTHGQFVNTNIGKFIDFDHNGSFQCVDAMRKYVNVVYGIPGYNSDLPALGNWGHAKDIFLKFPSNPKYFNKVVNGPNNFPKQGDIVFFKTSIFYPWLYGIDGHVAICNWADGMNMILFGQNYPSRTACSLRKFGYKDCLGWLTRK